MFPLVRVTRTYKNLRRLRHIVNVLLKHGFGHLVEQMNLLPAVSLGRRLFLRKSHDREISRHTVPERLRVAFEELGPTFVKFGQLLSTRPDLVPANFSAEFHKLQDNVPPFPLSQVREVVEEELGAPLSVSFPMFDEIPRAAASIAQVHYATLRSGEEVAVKIQRPGIQELLETDIDLLFHLAELLERHVAEGETINAVGIVEEFSRTVHRELDFNLEANHARKFRENFAGDPRILIPKVYWQFTTRRLLTLQRVEGISIDQLEVLREAGCDLKEISQNLLRVFFKMVLEDGFFYADPHPGNFVVQSDNRIGVVDFGQVGYLDEDLIERLAIIFLALYQRDYKKLAQSYLELVKASERTDQQLFQNDLRDLLDPQYGRPLKEVRIGSMINGSFQVALRHHIRLPNELVLLGKAMIGVEGLARRLDEDLVIVETVKPFATRIIDRRLDPRRRIKHTYRDILELGMLGKQLPGQLSQALKKMIGDDMKIEFRHSRLENLIREIDKSSNRIAFSLIISALIVGSSLFVLSARAPLLFGFPVLGLIGFLLAGLLGLGVVFSILRSGKL